MNFFIVNFKGVRHATRLDEIAHFGEIKDAAGLTYLRIFGRVGNYMDFPDPHSTLFDKLMELFNGYPVKEDPDHNGERIDP